MTWGILIVGHWIVDRHNWSCFRFFKCSDFFNENFDKIFHAQMNNHEQLNMHNGQYIHANRMFRVEAP